LAVAEAEVERRGPVLVVAVVARVAMGLVPEFM
jgi:hypothetical protein